MTNESNIDPEHPAMIPFRAAGYRSEDLIDPALVDAAMLDEFEAMAGQTKGRVVRLNSHGIESFEVGSGDVVETGRSEPFGTGVEYVEGTVQPINFAQDHGLLNDDLDDLNLERAGGRRDLTYFWGGDAERRVPDFSPEEAIEALSWWGHRGWVPWRTVDSMLIPWDETAGDVGKDDPDVTIDKIVRAPRAATMLASAADDVDVKSPDSGINGHDKRRRQRFYRNLKALGEAYGVDV